MDDRPLDDLAGEGRQDCTLVGPVLVLGMWLLRAMMPKLAVREPGDEYLHRVTRAHARQCGGVDPCRINWGRGYEEIHNNARLADAKVRVVPLPSGIRGNVVGWIFPSCPRWRRCSPASRRASPTGRGPDLRAEVGRLPLHRLSRRRRGRARQPQRAAPDALLPRGRRRRPARAAGAGRPRRRDRHRRQPRARVRGAAAADPPGRVAGRRSSPRPRRRRSSPSTCWLSTTVDLRPYPFASDGDPRSSRPSPPRTPGAPDARHRRPGGGGATGSSASRGRDSTA